MWNMFIELPVKLVTVMFYKYLKDKYNYCDPSWSGVKLKWIIIDMWSVINVKLFYKM